MTTHPNPPFGSFSKKHPIWYLNLVYCYHKVRGIVIIGWVYCYHNPFPLITHPGEVVPWAGSVTTCTDHMTRPHPHKIKGKRVGIISKSTYCLHGNKATFIFEAGIDCVNFSMIFFQIMLFGGKPLKKSRSSRWSPRGKLCWCLIWKKTRFPSHTPHKASVSRYLRTWRILCLWLRSVFKRILFRVFWKTSARNWIQGWGKSCNTSILT